MIMDYDKRTGNVVFNTEKHKYWDITNPEKTYISVTTLVHSYAQPFLLSFWSAYKALEALLKSKPEYWKVIKKQLLSTKMFDRSLLKTLGVSENIFNMEQQRLLDLWAQNAENSRTKGTQIHKELEESFYSQHKNIEISSFGIGGKFECQKGHTALDLEYGLYPEYLLYWESKDGKINLAGQSDLVIKQGKEISLLDHKTDDKIKTKGYYDRYNKKSEMMLYPLNNLEDCNFNHYSLQISTYAWMLQQLYPDFTIKDLLINHIHSDGESTLYHCKYLRDEVEAMLHDYHKQLLINEKRAARRRIDY